MVEPLKFKNLGETDLIWQNPCIGGFFFWLASQLKEERLLVSDTVARIFLQISW